MFRSTNLLKSIAIMTIGLSLTTFAAEQKQPTHEEMQEMMKAYAALTAPAAEHQQLMQLSGEWSSVSKMCMGPGAPMQSGTEPGSTTFSGILGGRFLRQTFHGNMMGMKYEGEGVFGFDKMRKEFTLFWIDNSTTAFTLARGSYDAAKKEYTFHGKMDEPMTGEKDKTVKYVLRLVDDKHTVFEIWDMLPGSPFIAMEITYTRK